MRGALITIALCFLLACGGGEGGGPVGGSCETDDDCPTRVCWNFNDYDSLCGGTVCSTDCESDQDCIDAAQAAGAASPDAANCGSDGLCDLVGTGLGSFQCALR